MRLGLWLPGVGVSALFAVASTILATGWLLHSPGSDGLPQAAAHEAAASSVPGSYTAPATATSSSPAVPAQSARGAFRLTVRTSRGELEATVAPLRATVRKDGTAEPIDPPHHSAQQWNTAAWIEQSAYPASPASGPSYVYGHACHYHVCPFTQLTEVAVGDTITVRTAPGILTYRVCATGLSPKAGNLVVPVCAGSAGDLVLVTCEYERGDTSVDNLVVAATLITRSTPTG